MNPLPNKLCRVEQGGLSLIYRFNGIRWEAQSAEPLDGDLYDGNRKVRCYAACPAYRQMIRHSWTSEESWEDRGAFFTRSLMQRRIPHAHQ